MTVNVLEKLFEHNNWANLQIVQACQALTDEQLDAEPQSATSGSIRETLLHLVTSQLGYLRLLTLPLEQRQQPTPKPPFAELRKSISSSGEALIALVRDESRIPTGRLQTRDGFLVEPWVVLTQIINHATEHREQIKSMLTALGVPPPNIDGWDHGEALKAMVPVEKKS
jgi:uncharacterized damage-inducible protein DinB